MAKVLGTVCLGNMAILDYDALGERERERGVGYRHQGWTLREEATGGGREAPLRYLCHAVMAHLARAGRAGPRNYESPPRV